MAYKKDEAGRAQNREYFRKWYADPANRKSHIARVQKSAAIRKALNARRVDELKRNPCTDCGLQFDPIAMDYDHRVGACKVANISTLVVSGASWAKIAEEISKCDLVCAICHRVRTKQRYPDNPSLWEA